MKKGRKILLIVFSLTTLIAIYFIIAPFQDTSLKKDLTGEILYLKRDNDGIIKLYHTTANLTDTKILYSHSESAEENKNIIGYYREAETVYFTAMQDGNWALFSIPLVGGEPQFIASENELDDDFHKRMLMSKLDIEMAYGIYSEKGSLYRVLDNGEIETLKKYPGFYDSKFNPGYTPLAVSPDKNYLLFSSSGRVSGVDAIVIGMLKDLFGQRDQSKVYVMDLNTLKTGSYVEGISNIEWIQ